MKVTLSPVRLFETPWSAAYQAPLSMGFSRQEYWSGVPLPSPFRDWEFLDKKREIPCPRGTHLCSSKLIYYQLLKKKLCMEPDYQLTEAHKPGMISYTGMANNLVPVRMQS